MKFAFVTDEIQLLQGEKMQFRNAWPCPLFYLYQYGSKENFHKKLQDILSKRLNIPTPSWKNKIKIWLGTRQQHSLNALLSQQQPVHPLLTKDKVLFRCKYLLFGKRLNSIS